MIPKDQSINEPSISFSASATQQTTPLVTSHCQLPTTAMHDRLWHDLKLGAGAKSCGWEVEHKIPALQAPTYLHCDLVTFIISHPYLKIEPKYCMSTKIVMRMIPKPNQGLCIIIWPLFRIYTSPRVQYNHSQAKSMQHFDWPLLNELTYCVKGLGAFIFLLVDST